MITNYNELMLGKYLDIQATMKDDSLEEIDKQVKMLSILSSMSESEILHLPIAEYKEMVRKSAFLLSEDKSSHQIAKCYNIGGLELVPCTDMRRLEAGQYIDFQSIAETFEENFADFLSIILVPKGKRYAENYDIIDVRKAICEELPVSEALSIAAFFLTSFQALMDSSLKSLASAVMTVKKKEVRKRMQKKVEQLEALRQNGVG